MMDQYRDERHESLYVGLSAGARLIPFAGG